MSSILVIDHRDSFVFNLVDDLLRTGADVQVIRSDAGMQETESLIERLDPDLIVLSPGPGAPADSGTMSELCTRHLELPILGVCLGLQVLTEVHGGEVDRAPSLVHGRASAVRHDGHPLFRDIANPFPAARYHSLCVTRVPDSLEVLARDVDDDLPMVLAHRELPRIGMQFHPESVLTPDGPRILDNALELLIGQPAGGVA